MDCARESDKIFTRIGGEDGNLFILGMGRGKIGTGLFMGQVLS